MPFPVGGLVACPPQKIALKIMQKCNSEQVLVLLSYIRNFQHAKIETVTTFNMKSPVNNKTLKSGRT